MSVTMIMDNLSPGALLRRAMHNESPLQIVGVINAYAAIMAKNVGFQAIYLSGAGVANASCGLPDLAMTTLNDVLTDVSRITSVCDVPLLVDADTGWGNALNIARTVKAMIKAGAAGMHLEDQVQAKRCGHLPGKAIVSAAEMGARIKAAVDARTDPDFVIMARTDALVHEGIAGTLERVQHYVQAGADAIFLEAVSDITQYQQFTQATGVPLLANITEFGCTPLYSVKELAAAGVDLILYPLSAFRAMNAAALNVYQTIRTQGSQQSLLASMQTRDQLYEFLDYHTYEQKLGDVNE